MLPLSLPAAVAAVLAVPPVDLTPYRAFAGRVETAVGENDTKAFGTLVDPKALGDRVFQGLTGVEADGVQEGFDEKLAALGLEIFGQYAKAYAASGEFRLLRVRVVGGDIRVLFRMVSDQGLNYLDMVLVPARAGGLRVADVYSYLTGELVSRSMGRFAAKAVVELRGRAVGVDDADGYLANVDRYLRLTALTRERKHRQALAEWGKMTPRVREEKSCQLFRVMAAAGLREDDPDGYRRAMADFLRLFPDDPAADLMSIDHLLLQKKYDDALRAVDRLDRAVGGDPYLNVFRANALAAAGRPAEGRTAAERGIAAEPDLLPAYWVLVKLALDRKDYRETARLLSVIETDCRVPLNDLTTTPEYTDFVKSPEYKARLAGRKKPGPAADGKR